MGLGYAFRLPATGNILLPAGGESDLELIRGTGAMQRLVESNLTEPKQEAVFFYGLFLRGVPVQKLREDIDVPPQVLDRWRRLALQDPWYSLTLERVVTYRKHVLAIFDSLVFQEMEPRETIQ